MSERVANCELRRVKDAQTTTEASRKSVSEVARKNLQCTAYRLVRTWSKGRERSGKTKMSVRSKAEEGKVLDLTLQILT